MLPTGCKPVIKKSSIEVAFQMNRDVENVPPLSEKVYESSPTVLPDVG